MLNFDRIEMAANMLEEKIMFREGEYYQYFAMIMRNSINGNNEYVWCMDAHDLSVANKHNRAEALGFAARRKDNDEIVEVMC